MKRTALSVALGMCLLSSVALAQSTAGGVFGTVAPGATVTISNNSGLTRTVTADADGKYQASNLPVGNYKISSGGVDRNVVVTVGGNANVSFVGPTGSLGTVTVSAANVPQIDVTAVDTRTIITAEELQRLPMPRSAESIALLSPGAVRGNGRFFGGEVSFGGSSVAENAYYLNGYFSGNPLTNVGGFTLPYGSIEQQETYTGGYGAKYGRSSGGVISQIGKSGSNDWHFGGQVVWEPKSLKSQRPDRFYPDYSDTFPEGYAYSDESLIGLAYDRGEGRQTWQNVYSGYVSGPIIQDSLFFFLSAEYTDANRETPSGNPEAGFAASGSKYQADQTKVYAKVNWNITDNHLLEGTYVADQWSEDGKTYAFDWENYEFGEYLIPALHQRSDSEYGILRYTGYLTDDLTLTVNYGHSRNRFDQVPYLTGLPQVTGATSQNPEENGGTPNTNPQGSPRVVSQADQYTDGLRVELEYLWGDHTFNIGIDNTKLEGKNQGTSQLAPIWTYGKAASNISNLSSSLGVGPTGDSDAACNGDPNHAGAGGRSTNCGYYVYALNFFDTTSMANEQKAWYLEDKWQVTDNFLLSLGVRADSYTNENDAGITFVDSGTQWQPRLGFAWDVNGDSSFKVFANAGRYFLNLPNAVAIRGASASTFTREYFTYDSIDENGVPQGLHPVGRVGDPGTPAGPVSSNGELGTPKDPLTFVPEDLKSQYQDEFALGFEANLTKEWAFGAKYTNRKLKSAVDDFCDPYTLLDAAGLENATFDPTRASVVAEDPDTGKLYISSYCYMFNPGGENTYALQEVVENPVISYDDVEGSYLRTKLSSDQLGFGKLKRTYNALDLFLERRWDGKWEARFDYTWSKSQGNSEGPANSDTGQGSNAHDNGVATSQNWDAYQIMAFADGYLPNDRRHQFKARGSYAITPDWLVSGNLSVASGAPFACFGYYDPDGTIPHDSHEADPIGYGNSYHTCFDAAATPGSTRFPWTHRFDAAVTWKPAYLDHKLAVTLNVFNVFNERAVTSEFAYSENDGPYAMTNDYRLPLSWSTPRYVQLSVSYDY